MSGRTAVETPHLRTPLNRCVVKRLHERASGRKPSFEKRPKAAVLAFNVHAALPGAAKGALRWHCSPLPPKYIHTRYIINVHVLSGEQQKVRYAGIATSHSKKKRKKDT